MRTSGGGGSSRAKRKASPAVADTPAMGQRWPRALLWPPASGGGRWLLFLALICCSPVLIPLACLSLPPLCIAGLCLRVGRRWRSGWEGGGASVIFGPCEEGGPRLLHRYLEDQLGLVGGGLALDCCGD